MKLTRAGAGTLVLVAALALAACGSDKNSNGSSSGAAGGGGCAGAGDLSADGSTAQQNAMNAWIAAYKQKCNATVGYSGGGSGQGVTDFINGKVDFAGSDAALSPDAGEVAKATKECGSQAIDLPMVTGPIAVAFNLNGVKDLSLTPSTVAKIFTGKIKKWNDPEIAGENKSAKLPSTAISVFFRSDQSGTTQNFENFLHTVVPSDYTATPSKTWEGAGKGANGSQGVQQGIKSTDGAIGYIELSYATGGGLATAKVDNGSGAVALDADSAGKAVGAAKIAPSGTGDLSLQLQYGTKAAGAYPIILVTYEIVCSKYKDAKTGAAVKAFLTYTSSSEGQALLSKNGSAPLPSTVLSKVQAQVAKIK